MTINKETIDSWETQIFECATALTNYVEGLRLAPLPPDHPVEQVRQKLWLLYSEVEAASIALETASGEVEQEPQEPTM